MDNACVIGWGTTGRATANALGITKYYSRSNHTIDLKDCSKFDFVFICLPTPVNDIGFYDYSAIYENLDEIFKEKFDKNPIFIIRSTVYPGFNKNLQKKYNYSGFASVPEFLSEDTAEEDAKNPGLMVIGADDVSIRDKVSAIFTGRIKYFELLEADSVTAEMCKLSLNVFFATKVIFANSIYDICRRDGARYDKVSEFIQKHKWGSKNHFRVNDKGGRGAGGKCLKKDLQAFASRSDKQLFREINKVNLSLLEITNKA